MALPDFTNIRRSRSRAITAENPKGEKGVGGSAASDLGPGRKGRAYLPLRAGDTLELADIDGPGVIRHVWITVPDATPAGPFVLRDLVLRMYWDGSAAAAVEVPLGDFFLNGFGSRAMVNSNAVVVAPTGGMNLYLPMPFRERARITLESQHPGDIEAVFFQIDYSLDDEIDDATGYLHAQFRRSMNAGRGADHVIVDGIRGRGCYIGTFVALTALGRFWWGEGEVKFYIDGDDELPTICGTGLEDYAGGAWAFQDHLDPLSEPVVHTFSSPFFGYPQREERDSTRWAPYATSMPTNHGLYRWHLRDPIRFETDLRVTLQQIGHDGHALFERSDDISTVAFWYQQTPAAPFPLLPDRAGRRPL